MGILYRIRQFWHAIFIRTDPPELERAFELLSPKQSELFEQLQPAEKSHALTMFSRLLEHGENQPDLLVAALLHDVGKLRYHLNPIERAMIVLVRVISPGQACRWGDPAPCSWEELPRWRKAFVVTEQHAGWGADMARQAGVSALTESLIRFHHQTDLLNLEAAENSLLRKLWAVDNNN